MTPTNSSPQVPEDRTLEEAATRLLRARDGEMQGGCEPLPDDPDLRRAHEAVTRAWAVMGEVGSIPEMIALRREALNNASRAAQSPWRRFLPEMQLRWIGAAAVLLAFTAAIGGYLWNRSVQPLLYETIAGERRAITLPDNSRIFLDESSRVSVSYLRRFRDLQLLQGQAEFDVATDPLRPFSVAAAGRRVIATGTLFNVDLLDNQLLVSLLEGSVVVAPESAESSFEAIHLKPSERLIVERATGLTRKTSINATDIEAWKLGKLVFEVEPLEQAVARVNRYARRKITLIAIDQAQEPISGVFNVGDVDAFAEAVSAQLPVRAEARDGGVVLVQR